MAQFLIAGEPMACGCFRLAAIAALLVLTSSKEIQAQPSLVGSLSDRSGAGTLFRGARVGSSSPSFPKLGPLLVVDQILATEPMSLPDRLYDPRSGVRFEIGGAVYSFSATVPAADGPRTYYGFRSHLDPALPFDEVLLASDYVDNSGIAHRVDPPVVMGWRVNHDAGSSLIVPDFPDLGGAKSQTRDPLPPMTPVMMMALSWQMAGWTVASWIGPRTEDLEREKALNDALLKSPGKAPADPLEPLPGLIHGDDFLDWHETFDPVAAELLRLPGLEPPDTGLIALPAYATVDGGEGGEDENPAMPIRLEEFPEIGQAVSEDAVAALETLLREKDLVSAHEAYAARLRALGVETKLAATGVLEITTAPGPLGRAIDAYRELVDAEVQLTLVDDPEIDPDPNAISLHIGSDLIPALRGNLDGLLLKTWQHWAGTSAPESVKALPTASVEISYGDDEVAHRASTVWAKAMSAQRLRTLVDTPTETHEGVISLRATQIKPQAAVLGERAQKLQIDAFKEALAQAALIAGVAQGLPAAQQEYDQTRSRWHWLKTSAPPFSVTKHPAGGYLVDIRFDNSISRNRDLEEVEGHWWLVEAGLQEADAGDKIEQWGHVRYRRLTAPSSLEEVVADLEQIVARLRSVSPN